MFTKTTIISAMMMLSMSTFAMELTAPMWNCELQTTKLKGFSLGIGKAISIAHGKGNVHCTSMDNRAQETDTPVYINMIGAGVGLGFTYFQELDVKAYAAGLATPNDMFGTLKLEQNVSLTLLNRGYQLAAYGALSRVGASVGVEFDQMKALGAEVSAEIEGLLITPVQMAPSASDEVGQ